MKIGDKVTRTPVTFGNYSECEEDGKNVKRKNTAKGVVVYIHPKGRYHTVEFKLWGGTVRESFDGVAG